MSIFIMENKTSICSAHILRRDDTAKYITKLLIISKVRIKSVFFPSSPLFYYLYLLGGNNTYFALRTRKKVFCLFFLCLSSIDVTFRQQGFSLHVDPLRMDAN